MYKLNLSKNSCAASPCIYRIKVRGWLSKQWSDWFDGMTITHELENDGPPVSTLTGPIIDQAALFGLLHKIYNMGLTLIAVNSVEPGSRE
jgi:hypothetical protein